MACFFEEKALLRLSMKRSLACPAKMWGLEYFMRVMQALFEPRVAWKPLHNLIVYLDKLVKNLNPSSILTSIEINLLGRCLRCTKYGYASAAET